MPFRAQCPKLGGEVIHTGFDFGAQRLFQIKTHLGFGRIVMPCRPAFQPDEQIIVEISDTETGDIDALPSLRAMIAYLSAVMQRTRSLLRERLSAMDERVEMGSEPASTCGSHRPMTRQDRS